MDEEKSLNLIFTSSFTTSIKKAYFAGEIDRLAMNARLKPIEAEIDEMVNRFYGIEAMEEVEAEEVEAKEEELNVELNEEAETE